MREILVINTRRMGDIYAMTPLLLALKCKNPNSKITLFTYEESKKAAVHLSCIDNISTLNRLQFLTLKKGEIYNKAFALDFLYDSIETLIQKNWDLVVNYSNDSFSTYLSSLICSTTHFCGIKYDLETSALTSSGNWISTLNEYITTTSFSFMPTVDFYINELGLSEYTSNENPFRTNLTLDKKAETSFLKIKEIEKEFGRNVSLVGIQFKTSKEDKDIPLSLLTQIINEILQNDNFYPVIISAPTQDEREITKKINSYFNNCLIIVECDLYGIPSILNSLDYLICPDTAIKHMADLCNLPTVELSFGASPLFKQGSRNNKSIIVSDDVWNRDFGKDGGRQRPLMVNAKSVLSGLEYISKKSSDIKMSISSNVHMIKPAHSQTGTIHKIISGKNDVFKEISMAVQRKYCFQSFSSTKTTINLQEYPREEIESWVKLQMSNISVVLKDILNTLRSLKINDKGFIKCLDDLLGRNNEFTISAIPIALFKFRLENMTNEGVTVNQMKIEKELFNLKTEIQTLSQIAKELVENNKLSGFNYEESRSY